MTTGDNRTNDVAEIKHLIERAVEAARAKDVDTLMSVYAPELVSFDIVPPLQYVGTDSYRQRWTETFAAFQGTMGYEVHKLNITAGEDVAFSHSLNHVSGTMTHGQKADIWVRWTACFRKIEGKWLIAHTQVSVPVDMTTGKAALNLIP